MTIHSSWFRVLSAVILATLVMTVATPGRAEALEPFVIIGIATVALAVLVIVVYLIVASASGPRGAAATDVPSTTPSAVLAAAAAPIQTQ